MTPHVAFLGIGSIGEASRVDAVFSVRRPCCDCNVDGVRLAGPCGCDDGARVVEMFADELDDAEIAWLRASGDANALAVWQRWGDDDATAAPSEGRAA